MENILFRAVIVLAVLSVLVGGLMFRMGYAESQSANAMIRQTLESRVLEGEFLTAAVSEYMEQRKAAESIANVGILLSLVMPPLLFLSYFVGRWIFTGRWRQARKDVGPK